MLNYTELKMIEIDCRKCIHCYDNGDSLHFWVCNEEGGCVDCSPNQCNGEYYKKAL